MLLQFKHKQLKTEITNERKVRGKNYHGGQEMLVREEIKINKGKFRYPVRSRLSKTSFSVKYVPSRKITT